jgi:hypothetical protein
MALESKSGTPLVNKLEIQLVMGSGMESETQLATALVSKLASMSETQ